MRLIDGYWVLARDAEREFGFPPGALENRGYESAVDVGGQPLIASKHIVEIRREALEASLRARRAREVADGSYPHLTLAEIDNYVASGQLPAHRAVVATPLVGQQTMPSGTITQPPTQLEDE
jgi:hypothetical protein